MVGGVPEFRLVCFHNAGSSSAVYSGHCGSRGRELGNPLEEHCRVHGGELLAVELPGREERRDERRERSLALYVSALFPVLAPLLQDVPYVLIGHSMGTWLLYELMRRLSAEGMPYPKQLVVSGFPAPDFPVADRPWSKNAPMSDEAFQQECLGWNVNEIVFDPWNWEQFSGMMRDDFTLFDSSRCCSTSCACCSVRGRGCAALDA